MAGNICMHQCSISMALSEQKRDLYSEGHIQREE